MRKKMLVLLCLPCLSLAQEPVLLDRVVAEVNGETITLSEVGERVERLDKEMRSSTDAETYAKTMEAQRGQALQIMIDELLILQEGKRIEVEVSDEDVNRAMENIKNENKIHNEAQFQYLLQAQNFTLEEYKDFLRHQIMILQTRRKALGGVEITDEEIRKYYEAHKEDFRQPSSVHLKHILFRLAPDAQGAEVKAVASRIKQAQDELNSGKSFEEVAKRYSGDPSAASGGDIGTLNQGQMLPEFEQVVFSIPVGEVSKPIRTKYGVHLLEVVERKESGYQPMEEVKDKLSEFLQDKRIQEKMDDWLAKLRSAAYVKIYEKPNG